MVNIPHALSTLLGALILTTLSMIAPSARADIAIDTFGPADAYSAFTYRTFGGLSPTGRFAMRFVPAAAANIDRVSAAMSYGSTGSTTVTLSISAEVGGVPGATALWTSNTVTIGAVGIYVFTGPSIALTGGQAYWIAAYAPSSAAFTTRWHDGGSGALGSIATGPSPWQVITSQTLPALRVESIPVSGACCSTLTGGCTVLPGSTCTLLGLRFDGGGSTCIPGTCRACRGDFNNSGALNATDIFDFLSAWFAGC